MYLSAEIVVRAIEILKSQVHPFLGITFLACKEHGLPVGSDEPLSLDNLTRLHLEKYHVLDRRSKFFFQPFKSPRFWVNQRYPSTGLQTVNTQTFGDAFIHPRGTSRWGFVTNYVGQIKSKLTRINADSAVAIDALAVWIYKSEYLENVTTLDALVEKFADDFSLTEEERRLLFSERELPDTAETFTKEAPSLSEVAQNFDAPPDEEVEGGRAIASLHLINVGPAVDMSIGFGERLTLITGDNGLGKSFLLDFAWWAATGKWAERPILPSVSEDTDATVVHSTRAASGRERTFTTHFDRLSFSWKSDKEAKQVEALAVYSRADGSFSIADPFRSNLQIGSTHSLTNYEVWNGKPGTIEGLVRDWPRWQLAKDRISFDRFAAVLRKLSPEDLGVLTPGEMVRVPGDPRDIPTIQHRYGTVPVTQTSSGVQRVLLLAYLIIWAWQEHELAASQTGLQPLRRMIVIVDELEAHLHPKWQRIVLPALMSVGGLLSSELSMQTISATHSPMILASMEGSFDSSSDVLYHLFGDGPVVKLEETPFVKYGDVSGWLTSPLFGLQHARSRDAERAIEDAKSLQLAESPTQEAVAEVSARLKLHLADDDKFWPRWLYFAEKHGVEL